MRPSRVPRCCRPSPASVRCPPPSRLPSPARRMPKAWPRRRCPTRMGRSGWPCGSPNIPSSNSSDRPRGSLSAQGREYDRDSHDGLADIRRPVSDAPAEVIRRQKELVAVHQRDHQDLTGHERAYHQPQPIRLVAADPRANCAQDWPGNYAAKKVDAVGTHLDGELIEVASPSELTCQDRREGRVEASECHEGAGETHERPAHHRPAAQCRKQGHQKPGGAQVTDAAPQARVVGLEQSSSHAERRGKQEPEPHPLRSVHDMTLPSPSLSGTYAVCPCTITWAPVASVTSAAPNSWPAVHAPGLTPASTRWVVSAAMAAVVQTPSPVCSSAVTVCPPTPVTSAQV